MEMSDRELLLKRLERLAIVLDELMPQCAELVRDAIVLLKEQDLDIVAKKMKEELSDKEKDYLYGILCKQDWTEQAICDGIANKLKLCKHN